MSRKMLNIFIISVISLIIVYSAASLLVFAASSYNQNKKITPDEAMNTTVAESYVEMIVCADRLDYFRDNTLSGNPIGSKLFGETLYAQQNSVGISRIYNKSGALLGYCKSSMLIDKSAKLFVEVPYAWNSGGQVSRLVDIRKYAEIFDAQIIYNEDEPMLVQYDTMLKLFEVAGKFYSELGYTLVLEKAYVPESKLGDNPCCSTCSHATGAALTLKMLKKGASLTESIPADSSFSRLLEDYGLIHDKSSSCFYDADSSSFMTTDYDTSSYLYYVWK